MENSSAPFFFSFATRSKQAQLQLKQHYFYSRKINNNNNTHTHTYAYVVTKTTAFTAPLFPFFFFNLISAIINLLLPSRSSYGYNKKKKKETVGKKNTLNYAIETLRASHATIQKKKNSFFVLEKKEREVRDCVCACLFVSMMRVTMRMTARAVVLDVLAACVCVCVCFMSPTNLRALYVCLNNAFHRHSRPASPAFSFL